MSRRLGSARVGYALVAGFALMILAGLLLGGFGKVVANGIVICLDCIGLI